MTVLAGQLGVLGAATRRKAGPWTPAELSLSGWWDATQLVGLSNGDTVESMPDLSGGNNPMDRRQNNPTYLASGIGGKPSVFFNESSGGRDSFWTPGNVSPVFTVAVAQYDGATFSNFNGLLCGAVDSLMVLAGRTNLTRMYPLADGWSDGVAYVSGQIPGPMETPRILAVANPAWTPLRLSIGCERSSSNRGWNGQISEVLTMANTPSTADRQKLEGYLAHKYALTGNLPSDHPYKTNPPEAS